MKFRFRLIESILNEDIAAVRKMFPALTDGEFEYIVKRFDPTYKAGSDSVGKYGKWLLNLAKKGDFEVDGSEEQVNYINDLLSQFEKKKASLDNKDIGQFKSLAELSGRMQNTAEPELTARQKERQMRKAYKDAELIWQNEDWMVWYPQNWDASCTLGKGTSWCTADSRTAKFYVQYAYDLYDADVLPIEKLENYIRNKEDLQDFIREGNLEEYFEEYDIEIVPLKQTIQAIKDTIIDKYSNDCVVSWYDGAVWFYNPHDILPYKECESPLYIFINKHDNSEKYQLYCGNINNDYFYEDPTEQWTIANKNDHIMYFSDLAWDDRGFADFAEEILGVPPQHYFATPPPWSEEYDEEDGEWFKWGLRYYNQNGVIKEEEIVGTEGFIDSYIDKLKADGWIITMCKQLEEV